MTVFLLSNYLAFSFFFLIYMKNNYFTTSEGNPAISSGTRKFTDIIQLSPEGEVNSGGYIPRREASRYISTALHRP